MWWGKNRISKYSVKGTGYVNTTRLAGGRELSCPQARMCRVCPGCSQTSSVSGLCQQHCRVALLSGESYLMGRNLGTPKLLPVACRTCNAPGLQHRAACCCPGFTLHSYFLQCTTVSLPMLLLMLYITADPHCFLIPPLRKTFNLPSRALVQCCRCTYTSAFQRKQCACACLHAGTTQAGKPRKILISLRISFKEPLKCRHTQSLPWGMCVLLLLLRRAAQRQPLASASKTKLWARLQILLRSCRLYFFFPPFEQ